MMKTPMLFAPSLHRVSLGRFQKVEEVVPSLKQYLYLAKERSMAECHASLFITRPEYQDRSIRKYLIRGFR